MGGKCLKLHKKTPHLQHAKFGKYCYWLKNTSKVRKKTQRNNIVCSTFLFFPIGRSAFNQRKTQVEMEKNGTKKHSIFPPKCYGDICSMRSDLGGYGGSVYFYIEL